MSLAEKRRPTIPTFQEAANYTVIPALFGTQRNRTVIELLNLIDVRIDQDRFRQAGEDPDFDFDDAYCRWTNVLDWLLAGPAQQPST